tara:strand:- start:3116 stop:3406 length:291 start_codon:yes stop_codon:yes gene_type:complete
MVSLQIRPSQPVDYDSGEYLGAVIDNAHEDGSIDVLVEAHEVDAVYSIITDTWPDEMHGAKFIHKLRTVNKINKVEWMGYKVINAEDVVWAMEDEV